MTYKMGIDWHERKYMIAFKKKEHIPDVLLHLREYNSIKIHSTYKNIKIRT